MEYRFLKDILEKWLPYIFSLLDMESGVDVFNDNLPKYKPSFANRNDSFLEILVSKPILSIPYDLTPLFNNTITSFSCIIEHLCLS